MPNPNKKVKMKNKYFDMGYYASHKEIPESVNDLVGFTRIDKDKYIPTYKDDADKNLSDFPFVFHSDESGDIEIPNPFRIKRV